MTEYVPHENLALRSTPFVWIIQYGALIIEPSIRGHIIFIMNIIIIYKMADLLEHCGGFNQLLLVAF